MASTAERFNQERETDIVEGMARYGWSEAEAQKVLKFMDPRGGLPFKAGDFGHNARPLRQAGVSLDRWLEVNREGYSEDRGYRPGDWEAFVRPALVKVWESVSDA